MIFVAAPARLSTSSATFEQDFAQRLHWSADTDAAIEQRVADTLADAGVAHWVLQECRAPGAATWALTAGQVERLGARFAGFAVRRG